MNYPQAYIDFLVHFHASRDYFECHEILEEYWKEHPHDPLRDMWHALIQVAVGLYHLRRNNRKGALKMLQNANELLSTQDGMPLQLDVPRLRAMLAERSQQILSNMESVEQDMSLPLCDESLIAHCVLVSESHGWTWLRASDVTDDTLIHRHTLRDRSDVIEARARAKLQKMGGFHNESR